MSGDAPGIAGLIALTLGDELAGSPWGGPPCLYTVWVRDGECELRAAALPPQIWEKTPPTVVLSTLAAAASALAADPGYRPPAGLYGAAFRAEAFALSLAAADDQDLDRAARTRFSAHPAGTQLRILQGVDITGVTYTAMQVHGDDRVETNVMRPGADTVISGPVPEAVTLFLGELTGWPARSPEPAVPEADW